MKRLLILIGLIFFASANAAEFWSIKFEAWTGEISTATIGTTISLPIYVKNLGKLQDNYTVSLISNSPNIYIETPSLTITDVTYGDVKVGYSKITLLVAAPDTNLQMTVSSALAPQNSWSKTLTIKSGLASLPDFDFFGVVQIMILAVIVVATYF